MMRPEIKFELCKFNGRTMMGSTRMSEEKSAGKFMAASALIQS